jgi:SAM-dependent methyltransferase
MIFDAEHYQAANRARWSLLEPAIQRAKGAMSLRTALDLGCGPGEFTKKLADMDFQVSGVDGRADNVAAATRRHPTLSFRTADVEDLVADPVDMVFCVGLLYHLENPFRALRKIAAVSRRLLVLETVLTDSPDRTMTLVDEESRGEDQGLAYIALRISEPALLFMLDRAGFSHAKRLGTVPFLGGSMYRGVFLVGREPLP